MNHFIWQPKTNTCNKYVKGFDGRHTKNTPSQSDGVRTENEKTKKPNLQKFGKRIAMTEAEHVGLVEAFGETLTAEQLAIADDWLLSKGKTQRDYCAFMRNWLRKTKAQTDLAAKRQATFATRYTQRQAVQTPDYEAEAEDLRRFWRVLAGVILSRL